MKQTKIKVKAPKVRRECIAQVITRSGAGSHTKSHKATRSQQNRAAYREL